MAIIKYNLVNSQRPSYITDGGYFYDKRDDTYIGIGSGGGTELTKAELVTRVQTFSALYPRSFTYDGLDDAGEMDPDTIRRFTDSEYETMVNDWCTEMGIS
tara:strand:+ start:915 stop:1217 length:303 start_codon:yes stop_codon:yes gene_type:complete